MAAFVRLKPIKIGGLEGRKLLPREEYEAYLTARSMIKKAKERAAGIQKDAKKAYLEEKEKGYQTGLEEAQEKTMAQMIETIEKTVDYLEVSEHKIVEIIEFSLKKILGEIPSEAIIVNIVRTALENVRNQKQILVSVSPKELSLVKKRIAEITQGYESLDYVDVDSDPRLSKGDCIIKSDMGIIDASLNKQLANLSKAFEKTLGVKKTPIKKPLTKPTKKKPIEKKKRAKKDE